MRVTIEPIGTSGPGNGLAAVNRETMAEHGLDSGDYVVVRGADGDRALTQVYPTEDVAPDAIRLDEWSRRTADVDVEDVVPVEPIDVSSAKRVTVALPAGFDAEENDRLRFRDELVSRGVVEGQTVPVAFDGEAGARLADRYVPIEIAETKPTGAVVVRDWTKIDVATEPAEGIDADAVDARETGPSSVRYCDVGGLDGEIDRVHEMIGLPMRHPELFHALGVEAPRGVLLHGPPGTGKTLLARAVANETGAHLRTISGPAIASKYYGESEERLREAFEEAERHAPAVVLIDDVDSLASERTTDDGGGSQVVAQLLSLLDELGSRRRVTVVGTTNRADAIDPALRRPGRFDREIEIGVPDRDGRREILDVHTRGVPLDDVDLDAIAERTHGFVGADIQNLVRESAMHAVRRTGRDFDLDADDLDAAVFGSLVVRQADVERALRDTEPSALREVFVEIPDVSWADVGGLDAVKDRLREVVEWPLSHPDAYERVSLQPATGVLLYGPPGTGKTLLAKAVANESESNFISIKGPELLDKYVGESERSVRDVFSKARENAPTVVFFDEIDAIASQRTRSAGGPNVGERVVSQLLTELDGLEGLEDVVVIATTNRPDLLDDALLRPGRFDRHVRVGPPDESARREIFAVHTREKPLADGVDLARLASETDGYVGADVESICREAASTAVREFVRSDGSDVRTIALTSEHFEAALREVEPGTSEGGHRSGAIE